MPRAKKDPRNSYVPKDYEDLYRYYIIGDGHGNSLCAAIIRKMMPHATPDETETLKHDVFVRLVQYDMIERFDPKKANFGGVIYFTARTVVSNHLNKKQRTPLTGLNGGSLVEESPTDEGEEFEPGVYSLNRMFGGETPNYEVQMDAKSLVTQLTSWAKAKYENPQHKRDESLYPLLSLLAEQRNAKECGKELGVTSSTIYNWIYVLREKLQELKSQTV